MNELFRLLSLLQEPHKFAEMFIQGVGKWSLAISAPDRFLAAAFEPSEKQIIESLVFYIAMLTITLFLFLLLAVAVGRKDLAAGAKVLGSAMFSLIFFMILSVAFYFSFWLLGGKSGFWGTCVAYIYSATPYLPILAFLSWMMVSAMPADLRPFALNPGTAELAGRLAVESDETEKFPFYFSMAAYFAVMFIGLFRTFQSLALVHDMGSWQLAGAIILYLLTAGVMKKLFDPITKLIVGEPEVRAEQAPPQAL